MIVCLSVSHLWINRLRPSVWRARARTYAIRFFFHFFPPTKRSMFWKPGERAQMWLVAKKNLHLTGMKIVGRPINRTIQRCAVCCKCKRAVFSETNARWKQASKWHKGLGYLSPFKNQLPTTEDPRSLQCVRNSGSLWLEWWLKCMVKYVTSQNKQSRIDDLPRTGTVSQLEVKVTNPIWNEMSILRWQIVANC